MGRLNNLLKFGLINANILFSVFGVFLVAVSIYLFAGNFGTLDPSFFIACGLIILFAGLSVIFGSLLGCQGVNNQGEKYGMIY